MSGGQIGRSNRDFSKEGLQGNEVDRNAASELKKTKQECTTVLSRSNEMREETK